MPSVSSDLKGENIFVAMSLWYRNSRPIGGCHCRQEFNASTPIRWTALWWL